MAIKGAIKFPANLEEFKKPRVPPPPLGAKRETTKGKTDAMAPVWSILITVKLRTPLLKISKNWNNAADKQANRIARFRYRLGNKVLMK